METTLNKESKWQLSEGTKRIIVDVIVYLFLALFVYTAYSKFKTIEDFKSILSHSPLIGRYGAFIAWSIPVLETVISLFLVIPNLKKIGLYASMFIMIFFTLFLTYGIFSGSKLPCNCGGVISMMTWTQHIWFNLVFIMLAIIGVRLYRN